MPRVSTRRLDKNIEQEIVANLDWLVSQLKSEEQAQSFLQFVLTREERLMLAKRLAVLYLLSKRISYSKIASALKITLATIVKLNKIQRASGTKFAKFFKVLDNKKGARLIKTIAKF